MRPIGCLIPASPEYASETGIAALVQTVTRLQNSGAGLNLLGILPTMVDSRSNEHKQTIEELRRGISRLRAAGRSVGLIAIAEAPRQGVPIWCYAPNAAEDYAGCAQSR